MLLVYTILLINRAFRCVIIWSLHNKLIIPFPSLRLLVIKEVMSFYESISFTCRNMCYLAKIAYTTLYDEQNYFSNLYYVHLQYHWFAYGLMIRRCLHLGWRSYNKFFNLFVEVYSIIITWSNENHAQCCILYFATPCNAQCVCY